MAMDKRVYRIARHRQVSPEIARAGPARPARPQTADRGSLIQFFGVRIMKTFALLALLTIATPFAAHAAPPASLHHQSLWSLLTTVTPQQQARIDATTADH
jgi:hypothetical protein